MLYEEMRMRKSGNVVRVYDISNGVATIFNPEMYQKNNNGWVNVKVSQLVPMDFPADCREYVSKTRKNKAKSRMRLVDAVWEASDGTVWEHKDIDKAIQHELEIMDYEDMNVGE